MESLGFREGRFIVFGECSTLTIEDPLANGLQLLSLGWLGFVATVGGVETSTADQEGGRAAHARFNSQLFQQTSLGCVKPQGATQASGSRALSKAIPPEEA